MSSTSTSTSAAATCTGNSWEIPTQDIACGLSTITGNYTSVMDTCCGDARVEKYNDGCGIYCLAQGQDGQSLLDCIQDNGVGNHDVFCGGNLTQTATAALPSKTADNDDDDDSDDASSTGDASDADTTDNAAVSFRGQDGFVSKGGLGVLAVMACSVVFGAGMVL
ncbi:hypothetical protein BDV18DRAFT_162438 [Aspergillus unguis]